MAYIKHLGHLVNEALDKIREELGSGKVRGALVVTVPGDRFAEDPQITTPKDGTLQGLSHVSIIGAEESSKAEDLEGLREAHMILGVLCDSLEEDDPNDSAPEHPMQSSVRGQA